MSQTAAPNVAFIFDCDGTLVNSTPVWAYAQPELLHRHGIDVTVDDFAQFEHLSLEDECQAYHDTWGIGANGEELYRELSDILIDGYSKVPPRDGLLAFLEQAKEAGIAMCVATSTPAELVQSALAGAGLDVFENEPQVPEALTGMDNVVLLPHIASATHETRQAMGQRVMDNLEAFERTGQLISSAY